MNYLSGCGPLLPASRNQWTRCPEAQFEIFNLQFTVLNSRGDSWVCPWRVIPDLKIVLVLVLALVLDPFSSFVAPRAACCLARKRSENVPQKG
jgi:hypothetical protein